MALDEIAIQRFVDEEQIVWNDVVLRAIEIAHDAKPGDVLREICGPMIDWSLINGSEDPEKEFHRQLAEILCSDLNLFRSWAGSKSARVEMEDDEGQRRLVLERHGSEIVARGPIYPRDIAEWCSPLWVVMRLIESGLIHDLCWDPVAVRQAA